MFKSFKCICGNDIWWWMSHLGRCPQCNTELESAENTQNDCVNTEHNQSKVFNYGK